MKTAYREWIGKRLKYFRMKRDLSRKEIADKLSMKEGTYRSYEDFRAEPSIYTIKEFCTICKVTVDKFLQGSPDNNTQKC